MPNNTQLIWEYGAVEDLAKIREFIEPHNKKSALHAAQRILQATDLLLENPYLGRPLEDMPEFHELVIPFGQRGYIMRYRVDQQTIIILRIWHARENRPR